MIRDLFLTTLYLKRFANLASASPLEQVVGAYLSNTSIDGRLIEKAVACENVLEQETLWSFVEKWRKTLALLLILKERDLLQPCRHLLLERVNVLKRYAVWEEFQLLSVYQAVAALLLGKPCKEVGISQLSGGACPLEAGSGHWPWSEVPHTVFHAELGILLCLYAVLSGKADYRHTAERLAEWHLNTLDHEYSPFSGLFSQEGVVCKELLLVYNFLLYDALAKETGRADFALVAEKQREQIQGQCGNERLRIPSFHAILEYQLVKETAAVASNLEFSLPKAFSDHSLALAGCRLAKSSSVATLFGGGSGMGCFHCQDVQVVNYGPQHMPLGDCRGFGIEGGGRLLGSHVKSVSTRDGHYAVEGVARLSSQRDFDKSSLAVLSSQHGGFWIDVKQRFEQGRLSIEAFFNGFADLSSLFFVFFVKAPMCLVGGKKIVKPRSFERYQGEVRTLQFQSKHASIVIDGSKELPEMSVIPLGGGENFWGADFLVAYPCSKEQRRYSWQLN
jgi:hypothetical protein